MADSITNLSGSPAAVSRITSAIASAFTKTPISLALWAEKYELSPPYPKCLSREALEPHFRPQVEEAAQSGAVCVEAGNYSAVAIWTVPNSSPHRAPTSSTTAASIAPEKERPLLQEFVMKVDAAKRRFLTSGSEADQAASNSSTARSSSEPPVMKPYYELKFLARNPEVPRVEGAISAVVRPFLERARNEGVPVWLEAADPAAVTVYEHFGFRVVERITTGVGKVSGDGWPQDGGEGASVWGMLFN